jgi:Na+/proline symporter
MSFIDWIIVVVPVIFVVGAAFYARKYVRGVVDYLAAGRVAGRYVISVGDMSAGFSVIAVVALVEAKYQTGFALAFWENIIIPISTIVALTGYCVYRYRETKSLSIGQFLEMRYSRSFRICAATLRTLSEMLTNAIGPAIAANFFIYFLGLPHRVMIFGMNLPCFAIVVIINLTLAVLIIWPAGRISLLITDCLQGLMSYPVFVLIVGYIIYNFSWGSEISPVMLDRVQGENFLNPFDIEKLRDFNIFALVVTITSNLLNRASWIGNDTTSAGRTPHEQKMAGILGSWRNGFAGMMCILVAITIITVMTHRNYAGKAKEIRTTLSGRVAEEVVTDNAARQTLENKLAEIPVQEHEIGLDKPLSRVENLDTPYLKAASDVFGQEAEGNFLFQKFRTLYHQMMMPIALRNMLPIGLKGIFALLMIMALISTDNSRIFNSSATIIQDVVMPFRKTPLSPQQHVRWLRVSTLLVAVFFFAVSLFFVQLDYINMFITIMAAIWLGGAGPVMIFGLYSRFGNTTGAFSSIIVGSGISVSGIILQQHWTQTVYPFLYDMGWAKPIGDFLEWVSAPFSPYIVWHMDPVKFPINSYELYFIAMMSGVAAYIIGSLVTYRKPYNLERMLHRGKYAIDGEKKLKSEWTVHNTFSKLIGITPEYTVGDKVIAWSVFIYTFIYNVLLAFVVVLIWNLISPWPAQWWSVYFFVVNIVMAAIVAVISTVWFMAGGIIDMRRLFKDLAKRVDNPLDDGRVEGHVSLVDKEILGSDPEDD